MPGHAKLVLRAIAGGLATAAVLKAHGLFTPHAVAAHGPFASPWLQVGLIYAELLLAAWFFAPGRLGLKWVVANLTFGSFLAVNCWQALEGQASCGCFGAVRASPWVMAAVDGAVLALLWLTRPPLHRQDLLADCKALSAALFAGLVVAATFATFVLTWFGSFERGVAWLRGDGYSVSPQLIDFGDGKPGMVREERVRIYNWTGRPLQVVGGTAGCSFVSTLDLPMTVAGENSVEVRLALRFPNVAGRFTHRAHLLVGTAELDVLPFQITGRTTVTSRDRD